MDEITKCFNCEYELKDKATFLCSRSLLEEQNIIDGKIFCDLLCLKEWINKSLPIKNS